MERDFLIVGQGIAGSCVALELIKAGKSLLLVDKLKPGAASPVAPGVINPVVFKRLTPTWQAQQVIPFAKSYYTQLEKQFAKKLFYSFDINKVITNEEEARFWQSKQNDPDLFPFVEGIGNNHNKYIHASNGLGKINSAGCVDLPVFLGLVKTLLQEKQAYLNADFKYEDMLIQPEAVKWKGYRFKKVIFCEGAYATQNPYFNWLPFKNTKGELLEISLPNIKTASIINKQVSIVPQPNGHYKCGSTYSWEWDTPAPEVSAKQELLKKLKNFVFDTPDVINQKAGIRPTMKDRRPCMGKHPKEKRLFIFTGGGSKGASLYPFFSEAFSRQLIYDTPLDKSVDIQRFYKLYS